MKKPKITESFWTSEVKFNLALLLILVALSVVIIYLIPLAFKLWLKSVQNLLGIPFALTTLALIFSTIIAIIIWMFYTIVKYCQQKPRNSWLFWTISISLIFLFSGSLGIEALLGYSSGDSVLRDIETGKERGELKCTGFTREKVPLNKTNTCKIDIDNIASHKTIVQFSGQINETLRYIFNESDKIEFPIPKGTENIQFKIELSTTEGEKYTLATGRDFKELSDEQIERNKERRVVYFLALLGIILFSVPRMMLDLKELAENKK